MRILICDDDSLIVECLLKYLTEYFKKEKLKCPEIKCFSSGEALLSDSGEKDIVFLDVEMPGLSGIYVGNELKKQNDAVIIFIVTSFMEYLDEAMRFHVFRYLSKPVDKQRLFLNMKDALLLYHSTNALLAVETKNDVHTISLSDLVFVEAQERRVLVHTAETEYYSVHPMQYWIDTLPSHIFFQSHRSYLVNMAYITDFDHTMIHLCKGQFTAYLTRRKYSSFKEAYLLYLEGLR